jgi:hypothetical protein
VMPDPWAEGCWIIHILSLLQSESLLMDMLTFLLVLMGWCFYKWFLNGLKVN